MIGLIPCVTTVLATLISLWIPVNYCLESHIHLKGNLSPTLLKSTNYYLEYYLLRTRLVEQKAVQLLSKPVSIEKLAAARNFVLYRDSQSVHFTLFWTEINEGKQLLEAFTRQAVQLAMERLLIDKERAVRGLFQKINHIKSSETSGQPNLELLNQLKIDFQNQSMELAIIRQEIESVPMHRIISGPFENQWMKRPLRGFNAVIGFLAGLLLAFMICALDRKKEHNRK
jgi:hypothetical protein